jgi:hypothetical protein
MLGGLEAEGEAEVLVHYTLAEDIRGLKRAKDAIAAGRPLPMACASSGSGACGKSCSSGRAAAAAPVLDQLPAFGALGRTGS